MFLKKMDVLESQLKEMEDNIQNLIDTIENTELTEEQEEKLMSIFKGITQNIKK